MKIWNLTTINEPPRTTMKIYQEIIDKNRSLFDDNYNGARIMCHFWRSFYR